jgi:acyl-CoA thioester hydrolase
MTDDSRIRTPFEGTGARQWREDGELPAPLVLYRTEVPESWVDYNEHMSESSFLLAFGHSADAFFRFIGIDEAYRESGHSLFTVETHIHNIAQARKGDPLELSLAVLDRDAKRVHILHMMRNSASGDTVAAGEQLLVHVDTEIGRSAPTPAWLDERLDRLCEAHAGLERPAFVGRPMGIRRG